MKQKVVIKVTMHSAKCKTRAMKTVVSVSGVMSAELYGDGDEKDKIMITGEGIDSVQLTNLLRKKVGYSELISVTPLSDEDKTPNKEPEPYQQQYTPYIYCHEVRDHNQDACTIM